MDDDGSAEKTSNLGALLKKRKKKDNSEAIKKSKVDIDTESDEELEDVDDYNAFGI
ncbi:hypothetical protein BJ742DRAFT_765698 [Cladochytrium replicatum]|nr:hypothetical protein BJ742DRAFT_765698 [Cladochytrium replicatum]